jgi:hypothetical protein
MTLLVRRMRRLLDVKLGEYAQEGRTRVVITRRIETGEQVQPPQACALHDLWLETTVRLKETAAKVRDVALADR